MKSMFVGFGLVAVFALGLLLPTIFSLSSQSQLTYSNFVGRAISATVKLEDDNGGGSGVVIGPHTILTAEHVVDGDTLMKVTLFDGTVDQGVVTFTDKVHDLAFVQVLADLPAAVAISHDKMKAGDQIAVIGNPMLVAETVTYGHIAADNYAKLEEDNPLLIMDVAVAPGNSGGAVIDLSTGELVGITDAALLAPTGVLGASLTGISFAVPATTLSELLPAF